MEVKMTKERWDALSAEERRVAVLRHDTSGTMALPQWAPLLQSMTRPFEQLSDVQRYVVAEIM